MVIPLNHRQKAFVQEYLKSGNATESAKAAGYSLHTAYSQGQRLLKNAEIQKTIKAHNQATEEETGVTVQSVVTRINLIATTTWWWKYAKQPCILFRERQLQFH